MRRLGLLIFFGFWSIATLWARPAAAQRELVERALAETRSYGHEDAIVHLAEEIGPVGVEVCLRHANRAGRLICAQSARYLEDTWAALPVLASVLQDHDRQLASRAAESMVYLLSRMDPGDLGPQEVILDEVAELLRGLRAVAGNEHLSPDIVVQVVIAASMLARLVGAGQQVAREALEHDEVAVRRAGASRLATSGEPDDVRLLVEVAGDEDDAFTAAIAAAGVCEATAGRGRPIPDQAAGRIRSLLRDRDMRPAVIGPLLACLARASTPQARELGELAGQHPNAGSRAFWEDLHQDQRN